MRHFRVSIREPADSRFQHGYEAWHIMTDARMTPALGLCEFLGPSSFTYQQRRMHICTAVAASAPDAAVLPVVSTHHHHCGL